MDDLKNNISALRLRCIEMDLEGADILGKYTDDQLAMLYNGIGPESFPDWLVDVLDSANPSLAAPCFIHDVEWAESDGKYESFTASNDRLRRNGKKVAKSLYAWYNPRRYIVIWDARVLSKACQKFGWDIWCEYATDSAKKVVGGLRKTSGLLFRACRYAISRAEVYVDPFD